MKIIKKSLILFTVLLLHEQTTCKNFVFNKTGQPITLTFYIDNPITKKSKKAPFPAEFILPLPEPFTALPKAIDMHSAYTDKVKASLACKDSNTLIGTDFPCKKIKPVVIKTPKITNLHDYELSIENDKLRFKKLKTIAGVTKK